VKFVFDTCVCVCVCVSPIALHYFASLYHDNYELEDGYTTASGAVRYGFDDRQFNDYSWRGYAIYSRLQVINKLTLGLNSFIDDKGLTQSTQRIDHCSRDDAVTSW